MTMVSVTLVTLLRKGNSALAFTAAASFLINTDWTTYSGEVQISYFTQMMGHPVGLFSNSRTTEDYQSASDSR
jgi:K+-transporting ATPase A subunit